MTTSSSNDPYLWLEDVRGERAIAWVEQQNARSLAVLEGDARYAPLHQDALRIATSQDRLALGAVRHGYLYNFWQDATHVRGIWRRTQLVDYARGYPSWDTLIDLDELSAAEHANWVWKGVTCSPSGNRCMVEISDGGRDASVYREFDIQTRQFLSGGFALPEAKSSVEYEDENTLLVATNWGPGTVTESGYPFIVRRWRRGTALASATEVLRGRNTDVGVFVASLDDVDGRRTMLAVQAETFFESTNYRIDPTGAPQRLTLPRRATIRALHKEQLVATIEEAWTPANGQPITSGALISMPMAEAATPAPNVSVLYGPGPRESIEEVVATRDALLVAGYNNVRGRVMRFAYDGRAWVESQIALPSNGAVRFAGSNEQASMAFAVFEDYLTPSTLYEINARDSTARVVRSLPAQFDAAPYVSEQFEATSRDGTRVPYFVVHRRGMPLDGTNPTLLYGYGGFQISLTPAYSPYIGSMWLARGGVYVVANIRGGGEFGPGWHQAGLRTHRQVVYDDFIAVAEDLIARRITSPRRLGIQGGSNGGLLMGVMLTQRPELFRAAVVQVPLLDMLRFDQLLAGASWVDEYGSPSNPEERRWLQQMSPYQNLRRRDDFPTPFFVTSTADDRVHPGHARKYAARMEELGMPFLFYENTAGGHAAAANQNEVARRRALEFTYLSQRLID